MKEFLCEALSTALMRSIPVAFLGLFVLVFMRRASGANRHLVCAATLLVLLALPVLTMIPQKRDIPLPSAGHTIYRTVVAQAPQLQKVAETAVAGAVGRPAVGVSVAQLFVWVYVAGVAVLALRHLLGILGAARVVRTSEAVAAGGRYAVRRSRAVNVPMATWWLRSTILLPEASLGWSDQRLRASIEHEAAHIRRGDLGYMLLLQLAKLLYWPNPFVWLLGFKLVEAAELATDDCVLGVGLAASEYADVLVQTAAERRGGNPAFSLSMARSSKVGMRVRAILDPLRRRGAARPGTLAVNGALLGFGALAMGRIGLDSGSWQGPGREAVPTAFYEDVRDGLTVPGKAENGFTAVDASGRKVQLIQIQRWTSSGVEAWKPDGTRIGGKDVIADGWSRHDPSELHLYTQFATDGQIDPSRAGIGSGPSGADDPMPQSFMGGYVMSKPVTPGKTTIVSLLGIPNPGKVGKMSVSYGYSEVNGSVIFRFYPNGTNSSAASIPAGYEKQFVSDFGGSVHMKYPAYGTPFVLDSHGEAKKDGHGEYVQKKVLSTEVVYTEKTYENGGHELETIAYRAKTGAKIDSVWNDGNQRGELYDFGYYWPVTPDEISHVDFVLHKSYHVVFMGFSVRAKKVGP